MFNAEDEPKVVPKGADKTHPLVSLSGVWTESNTKAFHRDIDLLNADLLRLSAGGVASSNPMNDP